MREQGYEFHPYASVLPMMGQIETNELAADIQANGLRSEIVLFDGKILDGRNRYKACQIVGVVPRFRDFNGDGDPIDYIVSVNVKRRHLTASQKALVAAKVLELPRGNPKLKSAKTPTNPKSIPSTELKTAAQVAKQINVSPATVEHAKRVLRDAPEEEVKAVERGEKSVSTVVREIRKAKDDQSLADKFGRTVPSDMIADWRRAEEIGKRLRSLASEIKTTISKGFAGAKQEKLKDFIYAEVGNSIISDASALSYSLSSIIPYALCPSCSGRQRNKCTLCRKRGWISKYLWNSPAVNDDIKKLIDRK